MHGKVDHILYHYYFWFAFIHYYTRVQDSKTNIDAYVGNVQNMRYTQDIPNLENMHSMQIMQNFEDKRNIKISKMCRI